MSKYIDETYGLWRSEGWTYSPYWAMKDEIQPYFIKNKPAKDNPPDIKRVLFSLGNSPIEELEPDEYFSTDEYIHFQGIEGITKLNKNFVSLFKKTNARFYKNMNQKYSPVQVFEQKEGYKELIGVIMPIRT